MPTPHDPETGELLEPARHSPSPSPPDASDEAGRPKVPGGRRKRAGDPAPADAPRPGRRFPRSPEEIETAARVRAEREVRREHEIAVLEALVPSLHVEGEPPVPLERPVTLDARTMSGRLLASVTRENGTEVRVCAKTYDGAFGGIARTYAHVCIWFRGMSGYLVRSKGVGLNDPVEMRAVGSALLALAQEIEAGGWTAPERPDVPPVPSAPVAAPVAAPSPRVEPAPAPTPSSRGRTVVVTCTLPERAATVCRNMAGEGHAARVAGSDVIIGGLPLDDAKKLARQLSMPGTGIRARVAP